QDARGDVHSRRGWAGEIATLIDAGRFAQAGRLVEILSECRPDPATARMLAQTHCRIDQMCSAPSLGNGAANLSPAWPAAALLLDGHGAAGDRAPAQWQLAVGVLGPLEVSVQGRPVPRFTSHGGRSVLRILAVHHGRSVARESLMDRLWPESTATAASNCLSVAVHALRRALREADPGGANTDYVPCRDGRYQLAPGLATWVDVEQFDRHRILGAAARRAGDLGLASARWICAGRSRPARRSGHARDAGGISSSTGPRTISGSSSPRATRTRCTSVRRAMSGWRASTPDPGRRRRPSAPGAAGSTSTE
ncbi:MAG: winged helix-turn-helix domain-containing protein, partial [Actinomycetia bacterium]|nr:winged helix-turn-helix domain-containing protein [Actinomycetes bacterium]